MKLLQSLNMLPAYKFSHLNCSPLAAGQLAVLWVSWPLLGTRSPWFRSYVKSWFEYDWNWCKECHHFWEFSEKQAIFTIPEEFLLILAWNLGFFECSWAAQQIPSRVRLQAWGHPITLTKSFATKKNLPLFVASHISQQTLRQRHLQSHQVLFVARVSLTLSMVLTGLHHEKKVTRLEEVIWCLSIQFYSKTAKTAMTAWRLKWLKYFSWISVLSKGTECVSALPGRVFQSWLTTTYFVR